MYSKILGLWKTQKKIFIFLVVAGTFTLYSLSRWIYLSLKDEIHIAVVAPITGESSANGKSYLQGIKLYVDPINKAGGLDGKQIILDVFDDQNKPELAKQRAEEIVKQGRAIGVIGHNNSGCSIAGGEVYKREGIPAITPASTNVDVTKNNEWYFRTIFNDNLQGRFIANYLNKILKINRVKIVSEELPYGKFLSTVFAETARSLGMTITYNKEFNTKSPTLDADLKSIADAIKSMNDTEMVFIAMHTPEGAKFLKLLKEAGARNQIIAPDAFASQAFIDKVSQFKREEANPGYYSNGLFVTTPLIFDNASQKAQNFKDVYESKYGQSPDWRAVYSYDSVMTLIEAVKKTDISGSKKLVVEERKKIKEFLVSLNTPSEAVEGATGLNYFDENGDSPKPVSIGVYKNNNVISSLTQLQLVRDPSEILNPERALAEERMLYVDNKYLYKTNVVYTGVEIVEITDLDISKLTYTLDFYIWFRYAGKINPENIEFLNSVEPVSLGEPIDKDDNEQMSYRVYHAKGKFRGGSLPVRYVLEQTALGISFQHKSLTRNNLIYVIDFVGMGIGSKKTRDNQKRGNILNPSTGYAIASNWFFPDTLTKTTLGSPRYLSMTDSHIEYSRFNMGVRIKKDEISLRRFISPKIAIYVLVFCVIGIMGLGILSNFKTYKPFSLSFWFGQTILVYLILVSSEVELVERLVEADSVSTIRLVLSIYDLLWWIIPASTVTQLVERLVWLPLEARTEHKIPTVVRKFANFLIYLLTIFGIVAFVYDQRITSLLATSGVVAMIIGLAIQVNIANVFSGIAINLERPFRVGDWIKIGSIDEGKVVDITWRTTRIQLRNLVIMSIPNSMASEAAIVNFSMPEGTVEMWFTIHIDPKALPQRVVKVLMDALLSSDGVLTSPGPYARFNEFSDWSADYLFGYCFKDYGKKNAIRRAVWQNIWTHLKRAGINPAFQRQELFMHKGYTQSIEDVKNPLSVVNELYMFHTFTEDEKIYLSQRLKQLEFHEGDFIVRIGEENYSMFVIIEGVVKVQIPLENGEALEVARLGSGNFFGEMSLLTGAKRTANIIASSHTFIYEITKEDIAPLLENHPEIYKNVKQVLAERKENLQSKKEEALYVPPPKKVSFYQKMKQRTFKMLGIQKEILGEANSEIPESKDDKK
ncbi:MAG: ABC transporter substrate-binding protein [Leptospiraceae bacterium]|nr:ABC transporter substrate-binding protein [Leptospiraceae bacterium]